ncbi:MAG: MFS transporter [Alphaproteobacteria bacterium]|nr:MFS transporter [Alphaproteobacteria bacterium]
MVRTAGMTGHERWATLAVLAAMALVVLDTGLMNVALPTIGHALRADAASIMLVVSSYQAALLAGLLPAAHLAERFGARSMFIAGVALFSAASIAAACGGSLPMLVTARIFQGFGGSTVMALGIALLRTSLGNERLGAAIAWNALTVALCSAAAPIAGAAILTAAQWPWLFLGKLPVALVALAAATALPRSERSRSNIDLLSITLHTLTAGSVVAAAQFAVTRPATAVVLAVVAATSAALLFRRNASLDQPLVPLDLLELRAFRRAVLASVCCFAGQTAGLLALPLHLQLNLHRPVLTAGLVLVCWPMGVAAASPVANRLARRMAEPVLCATGAVLLASGLIWTVLFPAQPNLWSFLLGALLGGVGFGLFQVPNNRRMFLSAPAERSAATGGLQGSARLAGQTTGALVLSVLLACSPATTAIATTLIFASICAAVAALVSAYPTPSRPQLECCRVIPFESYLRGDLR